MVRRDSPLHMQLANWRCPGSTKRLSSKLRVAVIVVGVSPPGPSGRLQCVCRLISEGGQ